MQWLFDCRFAKIVCHLYFVRYSEDAKAVFDIQIAGYLYTIDFENMEQYRKNDRNVSRAMKRDHIKHVDEVRGKAGIRLNSSPSNRTVEGGSTTETVSTNYSRQRSSDILSPSQAGNQTESSRSRSGRHSQTVDPRAASHPTPVDISQLVADMNLLDRPLNSSDDEPESLV